MADEITDVEIQKVAESAFFTFDVAPQDNSDSYIVSGDGTDDLDRLLGVMTRDPRVIVRMDVEPQDTSFKLATVDDVQRLRAAFMGYYTGTSQGTLAKPNEYVIPSGVAVPLF